MQRNGSTYLCECVSEYGWGIPKEYYIYLIRMMRSGCIDHDFENSIKRVCKKSTVNNISAVKVMANYLQNLEKIKKPLLMQKTICNELNKDVASNQFPFNHF